MLEGLEIKLASKDDLDAIVQVGDKLFDLPVKINRAKEFLVDPRHHLMVAYFEQKIVGLASGFHYVHPDKDPVLFIDEVGVIDDFQKKGIGKTVVQAMCDHGKSLGCSEAWVLTDESNEAAIKTYLGAGGKKTHESIVMVDFKLHSSK